MPRLVYAPGASDAPFRCAFRLAQGKSFDLRADRTCPALFFSLRLGPTAVAVGHFRNVR